MDKKTYGAWLIYHTNKLMRLMHPIGYGNIIKAGKSGILLSALSETKQSDISREKAEAVALAAGLSPLELPTLLQILQDAKLIDIVESGAISVLGLTTHAILQHTTSIFTNSGPNANERAVIGFSEEISIAPQEHSIAIASISDKYKLDRKRTEDFLKQVTSMGLIDYESLPGDIKVYFNGNLFKRDNVKKAQAILSSLKADEERKVLELDQLLVKSNCIAYDQAVRILGEELFAKLHSIAFYDITVVKNSIENYRFLTRPSGFNKYGNPLADDALDFAKAFVASLTYGMQRSPEFRGRIKLLPQLMSKLIDGHWVGPATAIGQDYQVLEMRRVVETKHVENGLYRMRLLKKDVGELALQAIQQGDVSEILLKGFPSATVSEFAGPEINREETRKIYVPQSNVAVLDLLRTLS